MPSSVIGCGKDAYIDRCRNPVPARFACRMEWMGDVPEQDRGGTYGGNAVPVAHMAV